MKQKQQKVGGIYTAQFASPISGFFLSVAHLSLRGNLVCLLCTN